MIRRGEIAGCAPELERGCSVPARGPSFEPISVRIPEAVRMTGLSRSRLYELIKAGEIAIAKDGSSTLVLVSSLRAAVQRRLVARPGGQ